MTGKESATKLQFPPGKKHSLVPSQSIAYFYLNKFASTTSMVSVDTIKLPIQRILHGKFITSIRAKVQ